MRKKSKLAVCALGVAAALAAFRLCLPALALRAVNEKLGLLQGYEGHVDSLGLSLWRGAYRIDGVRIDKSGGKVPVPFFSADSIDFSLEWPALLRRRIVTTIKMASPRVNFVKGPTPETSAVEPNESFARTLKALAPFEIDRLDVDDGQIHYRDFESVPKIDIALTRLRATARNLRNTEQAGVVLPADVRVEGKAFETGDLSIALKADLLNENPTFELKQTLTGVELPRLNDFFDAYAKVRVKKGVFGLYAEAAAKDGNFAGYAKPIFTGMVLDKRAGGSAPRQAWAVVASAVKWIFSNKRKKQVATKIPIAGRYGDAKVGLWAAIGGILKNAYVQALTPALDGMKLDGADKAGEKGGAGPP